MQAKYDIYCDPPRGVRGYVGSIVIDIEGNPNSGHNRATAIRLSGREGSDYEAHFAGYDCPTIEVPVIAMEAMALLLNGDLSATNWQTLRKALLRAGCIKEKGLSYQVVYPK